MKYFTVSLAVIFCMLLFASVQGDIRMYQPDCSKYLNCAYNRCAIMDCGPGTEFNPYINACDYPIRPRNDCVHN
ncbi:putative chitinase 10 [Calliopsis andreniformis]|uniref:putative chitinase 10 n=1 Tax=Calliopsis andreniformis TaxID=337506 RepID=UPI003FCC9F46